MHHIATQYSYNRINYYRGNEIIGYSFEGHHTIIIVWSIISICNPYSSTPFTYIAIAS